MAFQLVSKSHPVPHARPAKRAGVSSRFSAGPAKRHSLSGPRGALYAPVIQAKCACGGRCPGCASPNLTVSQPGDRYEREADRVAAEVVQTGRSTAAHREGPGRPPLSIQRAASGARPGPDPTPTAPLRMLAVPPASGRPLDRSTREFMEPRFGHDFSGVRVYTDRHAARSAASVRARAYTVGSNIVFAANTYAPGTREGDRLLAHELAHVVQQSDVPQGTGAVRLSRVPASGAMMQREQSLEERAEEALPSSGDPKDMDEADAASIGAEVLQTVGYQRLMELAMRAGLVARPGTRRAAPASMPLQRKHAEGPTLMIFRDAAAAGAVLTEYAIAAGVTSQLDTPAPGPADVVALGILVVGLAVAGYTLVKSSPRAPSRPRTRRRRKDPCQEHMQACLLTSLADEPGSVFGSSRCLWCAEVCRRDGGVWPSSAPSTSGSVRCDYWNF